jgi:hypothetical protein
MGLSFIKAMNDQKWLSIIKKVVQQGYERPKLVEHHQKVVHQCYERPKVIEHHQKGRSSRL